MKQTLIAVIVLSLVFGTWDCKKSPTEAPPLPIPPPVLKANAAIVSGPTVSVLSGYVNPNGSSASYHFEYGATSNYGQNTVSQNAGSGNTAVLVTDTLGNVAEGTRYHWRFVVVNSGGTAATSDSIFSTPRDLDFPLAVGTTWTYAYSNSYLGGGQRILTAGVHVWQVQSSTVGSNCIVYTITDSRLDTVTWDPKIYPDSIVTTPGMITLMSYVDSILISAPEDRGSRWIPRALQGTNDTLNLAYPAGWWDNVICVRGMGIVGMHNRYGGTSPDVTDMTLISNSKP